MTGELKIRVSEAGYGCDCDLSNAKIIDKIELMGVVAALLDLDADDIKFFAMAYPVLEWSRQVQHCATTEEVTELLQGTMRKPPQDAVADLLKSALDMLEKES